MEQTIYIQNPWWEKESFETGISRAKYVDLIMKDIDQNLVQIITGLRRVGKSTIMKQVIQSLITIKKIQPDHVLFFTIEDPALSKKSIIEIINEYRIEFSITSDDKIYVFIDEIQFKEEWEKEIKTLYDTNKIKFILTGSSAVLLSEKVSYLTGRYLTTYVNPLSFEEYLQFSKTRIPSKNDLHLLSKTCEEYLLSGGMPEYVLNKPTRYLQTTVESILFKDLVTKFQIRNPKLLSDLLLLLADRVSSTSSSLKLSKILDINKDTILAYIDYLNKVFLINSLANFSQSRNSQMYNPPKVYFTDNGILNTYSSKTNYGALAENAVFNHINVTLKEELRFNFGYWNSNVKEVDFIVQLNNTKYAFESKYIENIEELPTESIKLLLEQENISKVFVISKLLEGKIEIGGKFIEIIPIYKFLKLDIKNLFA